MGRPFPAILDSPDVVAIQKAIGMDMRGSSSFVTQQFILAGMCPKMGVIESAPATAMITSYGCGLASVLDLFRYFEESIGQKGQRVAFVRDVLSETRNFTLDLWDKKSVESDLELYIKEINQRMKDDTQDKTLLENSIYLRYLSQTISTETVTPFSSFNHPILRLVVVSGNESIEEVKLLLNAKRISDEVKWLDSESIKPVVLVLVDDDDTTMLENALNIQETLKCKALIIPVVPKQEQDVCDVTLDAPVFGDWRDSVQLPKRVFESWNSQLLEVVSKEMTPFMNSKIKQWNDEVVGPKKSLTNRLFNPKKWGTTNKSSFFSFGKSHEEAEEVPNYNTSEGYYLAKSPESIIKKLGDWYFMLGEYKNAFSMYELVKKDMTNDKAYLYTAALQESSAAALLLGASKRANPFASLPEEKSSVQSISIKIMTDVINPSTESAFYTYLSKYNLKSYCIRMSLLLAEHLFLLGQSTAYSNSQGPPSLLASMYFSESINLFKKLIDLNLLGKTVNSILMLRIAYIYYSFDKPLSRSQILPQELYYEEENPNKLVIPDLANMGRQRNRKSILWMLMAAKELDYQKQKEQIKLILDKINNELGYHPREREWLEREGSLFMQLKSKCTL